LASDPDDDPLDLISVSSSSTNGGAVNLAENQVTYTPRTNYIGLDRFTYTVSDGRCGTISAFVLLQVRSTNLISGNMLPPVTVSNGVQVSFLGLPNLTYTLQRSTNVSGPWIAIGPVPTAATGLGVFTDTNPPPSSAFYRTTYP
jgi:hypothetical protein